jgi:hypothetical protein
LTKRQFAAFEQNINYSVKVMKKVIIVTFLTIYSGIWLSAKSLEVSFEDQVRPKAPDYSNEKYWSALPWRLDSPDDVPNPEYTDNQNSAEVDVFFYIQRLYSEKMKYRGLMQ